MSDTGNLDNVGTVEKEWNPKMETQNDVHITRDESKKYFFMSIKA